MRRREEERGREERGRKWEIDEILKSFDCPCMHTHTHTHTHSQVGDSGFGTVRAKAVRKERNSK